jgi:hypothetical protein
MGCDSAARLRIEQRKLAEEKLPDTNMMISIIILQADKYSYRQELLQKQKETQDGKDRKC